MTSLAKGSQIVELANLQGNRHLSLQEIVTITRIPLSTYSNIIRFSVLCMEQTSIRDPSSEKSLRPRPTAVKGLNQALSPEERNNLSNSSAH